jgi:hypothetical protein
MSEKQEKAKYYKIEFDKFIDLTIEIINLNTILSDYIKQNVPQLDIEFWDTSSLPYFMESYVVGKQFKDLLEDKINNPSQAELDYSLKNNTKDILLTKDELSKMQGYIMALEDLKSILHLEFGINLTVH